MVDIPESKKEEASQEKKDTVIVKQVDEKAEMVSKPAETTALPLEKKEETKATIKEQPVIPTEETKVAESYKASQIKKWAESATSDGFGMVFIDGEKDTIRLVIPNPKPVVNVIKEEPKEEKKFLDISTEAQTKVEISTDVKPVNNEPPVEKTVFINKCSDLATEGDFLKLRKRMAAGDNDDEMISEAKKYFKTKCFNTAQIKNLAALFLNDEGKYRFFEASYKYVSDLEAFNSLQAELKDEYYAGRFKAMLRN
ncbi:MAG: hypothetical protein H7Y01_00945 [Ferruginibacter sp.]|nr:hypothetical protein [Chitinophagaceae bacterium]